MLGASSSLVSHSCFTWPQALHLTLLSLRFLASGLSSSATGSAPPPTTLRFPKPTTASLPSFLYSSFSAWICSHKTSHLHTATPASPRIALSERGHNQSLDVLPLPGGILDSPASRLACKCRLGGCAEA